jgi:uncharacterized protein (DUF342 family)
LIIDNKAAAIDYSSLPLKSELASKKEVEDYLGKLQNKLKALQLKEDEFNKNAALVPDNDPNVTLINERILTLKENVEKLSNQRTSLLAEYKKISDQRVTQFLGFFDNVARQVELIYATLTTKEN